MYQAEMPPLINNLSTLSLKPRTNPYPESIVFDTTAKRPVDGDHEHQWAVLICGESIGNGSERRFWFDLSCVYTVLVEKYGFLEGYFDNELTPRHIIVTAPPDIVSLYNYGAINGDCGDLNGNDSEAGDFFNIQSEAITLHNKDNIIDIFGCFAGDSVCIEKYRHYGLRELHENDQLFIYITGHGRQSGNGSCYFPINTGNSHDNQRIFDYELVEMLEGIKCSQITLMMQTCYSGGFVEKFMNDVSNEKCLCKNRIGFSASSVGGIAHNDEYGIPWYRQEKHKTYWIGESTYYWTAAALGYYPLFHITETYGHEIVDIGPWSVPINGRGVGNNSMDWDIYFDNESDKPHIGHDINPDTDHDGVLSLNELFVFSNDLNTWSITGYYNIHPSVDTTDIGFERENPLCCYESSFTQEAATLVGFEGQIDGVVNSGMARQPYRLCGDLWIDSNSELTMWDDLQSPNDVKIFIKPSGKLILDGATLTNLPEAQSKMWKGVQVWGNNSKHQFIENGRYWQGLLDMKNGASIQNAFTGIDIWNPEDYNSTGGIVKAVDSRFINNTIAVSFHPYENQFDDYYHTGNTVVRDNVSYFRNCVFSIDSNYVGPDAFKRHANLLRVRGVGFYGCHFNYSTNNHPSLEPIGIHSWDAGFKLSGVCVSENHSLPCQVFDNSTFNGFDKAVVSVNDGSVAIRPVTIKNTDFTNNNFGIYAIKSGYPLVLNSTFNIGKDSTFCAVGIYAEHTPYFTIEQDTFALAQHHPDETFGIIIKNSKSQNLVYKNYFKDLYCANLSIGKNNTWMMPRDTIVLTEILGLEYRCNENTNNWCDFYVLGWDSYQKIGIQNHQGTINVPANNTFSHDSRYQFINRGNFNINYYFNANQMYGAPSSSDGLTLVQTIDTVGCPSHYSFGGVSYNDTLTPVLSNEQKLQRETDYYDAYTAYISIKSIYEDLLNGGDTEGEIDDIRNAVPSDMLRLRAQLLGHSPYLTDKVLVNMLHRDDIFPHSVLFEILASNPDELKRDALINYLQNMDNPLPDYMIELLNRMADSVSTRTAMESLLSRYSQKFRQAASDIIRNILCDTVINMTSLVGWLGNMNDMESDREIVSIYLEEGKYDEAFSLANLLPVLYGLTGDDLIEHNNYITLLELYYELSEDKRNTLQLDSLERVSVEKIANYGSGMAQAMAKVIMMEAYGYSNDDCPNSLEFDNPIRGVNHNGSLFSNKDTSVH